MVWLEQNVSTYHNVLFYQNLLNIQNSGFSNLWDSTASMYCVGEGIKSPNWNTFYADATCQLWPIWTGIISPSSSRAANLYDTFNSHYLDWQNGKYYDSYPWAVLCYVAAIMGDSSRVNSYLTYIQVLLMKEQYPANWYCGEAAFTLRAAKRLSILTVVKETVQQIPQSPTLEQNYPNPFNPATVIKYSVPKSDIVTLKVYNMLGQEVATLVNQQQQAGNYNINFNATRLASGVYMYRIQTGGFSLTKKMILIK
jgi:hypothetical protein